MDDKWTLYDLRAIQLNVADPLSPAYSFLGFLRNFTPMAYLSVTCADLKSDGARDLRSEWGLFTVRTNIESYGIARGLAISIMERSREIRTASA